MEEILEFFEDIFYKGGIGSISILKNWNLSSEEQCTTNYDVDFDGKAFFDKPFIFPAFVKHLQKIIEITEEDVYFSINNFMRKRNSANLWRLNCFALDFDFYKIKQYQNLTPSEFYFNILKKELEDEPSYVIDSGKGLYLIYNFEDKPVKQVARLYQAIYQQLYLKYEQFGADRAATLLTQVIRIPGTLNTKTLREVTFIEKTKRRYSFAYFKKYLPFTQEEVKAYKEKKPIMKMKKPKKYTSIKYLESTKLLFEDLKKLITMRNQNNYFDGYRELLIYLVRERCRFSNMPLAEEIKIATQFNQLFTVPLSKSEVLQTANPSTLYHPHKKATIIQKLNISKIEQQQLQFLCKHKLYVLRKQQKKRKSIQQLRFLKNQDKLFERRRRLVEIIYKEKIFNKKILAERLNTTVRTIYRDLEYINQHKALFAVRERKNDYIEANDEEAEAQTARNTMKHDTS